MFSAPEGGPGAATSQAIYPGSSDPAKPVATLAVFQLLDNSVEQ
jgi:hypothetical protein